MSFPSSGEFEKAKQTFGGGKSRKEKRKEQKLRAKDLSASLTGSQSGSPANNESTACEESRPFNGSASSAASVSAERYALQGFGNYIIPNESATHLFADFIRDASKQGCLLTVGTFRALIAATLGDFSAVAIIDKDDIVHEFNTHHLRLISSIAEHFKHHPSAPISHQRKQYLCMLKHSRWLTQQELDAWDSQPLLGLYDPPDSQSAQATAGDASVVGRAEIPADVSFDLGLLHEQLRKRWSDKRLSSIYPDEDVEYWLHECGEYQKWRNYIWQKFWENYYHGVTVQQLRQRHSFWFWEDDQRWSTLTKMLQANRVSAVLGDIFDKDVLGGLPGAVAPAQPVDTNHQEDGRRAAVTVVDLSNVMEYLHGGPEGNLREVQFKNIQQRMRVYDELQWSDALFLTTSKACMYQHVHGEYVKRTKDWDWIAHHGSNELLKDYAKLTVHTQ